MLPIETISLDAEVEALLAAARLPVSDLSSSHNLNLLGARDNDRLVGAVGIEVYADVAMLRSLTVAPARSGTGLGVRLVLEAESWAAAQGLTTLYLLTTTAAGFFAKLGYEVISRSEAPAVIAATAQFADLCPASSTFMRKALARGRT